MRLKLTKQIVADADSSIMDTQVKNLELRVLPSGSKKYALRYWCKASKTTRRIAIGDAGEITPTRARELAAERLLELHDPSKAAKAISGKRTLQSVWEAYKENYSDIEHSKRWNRNTEVLWERHVSQFQHYRLDSLKDSDVRKFLKSKGKHSASYRNKMLQLLKNLYTFAERNRWVLESPLVHIRKEPENNAGYRLTNDEIASLLNNLDDSDLSRAIRLALFTGARRANVMSAHSDDFDFNRGIWTIPAKKVKNKETQRVFLSIYTRVDKFRGYYFPANSKSGHRTDLQDEFKDYLRDIGLQNSIRFHDLKHTFVSCLYRAGIDPHLAFKMGGHKLPGMSFHYAHETDDELKAAYIRVGEFIASQGQR